MNIKFSKPNAFLNFKLFQPLNLLHPILLIDRNAFVYFFIIRQILKMNKKYLFLFY